MARISKLLTENLNCKGEKMNTVKTKAIEVLNDLHRSIPYDAYCTVMDGLQTIERLEERDRELEEL